MIKALAALVALASLAAVIPALIALVKPSTLRLPSQWYALPLGTAWLAGAGILLLTNPTPDASGSQDPNAPAVGVLLILVWGVMILIAWAADRSGRQAKAPTNSTAPIPTSSVFHSPWANPEPPELSNAERTRLWVSENAERIRRERQQEDRRNSNTVATPPPHKPTNDLLRSAQQQIAAQQREIESLKAELTRRTAKPIKRKSRTIQFDPARPTQSAGLHISFTYADTNGEVTDRALRNWSITGVHLQGFCLLRKGTRTFRMDRVIEWGEWE